MKHLNDLNIGLEAYQNKDYITSLKHFAKNSSKITNDVFQSLSALTMTAVANLQLCNYNEAGQQLAKVYSQIVEEEQKGERCEMDVLKIKVLCNLVVLELVSCGEKVEDLTEQMMDLVRSWIQKDEDSGRALFKVMVKSLFGFDSFKKMQEEYSQMLSILTKNQNKVKNQSNLESLPSPLLISSLSLYCHLAGNLKTAFLLQKYSYELSKSKQLIPSILALRHLEELSKELKDDKSSRQYRNELILAMSEEELEGVAEQTLFRNYRKKLDFARGVVEQMIMFEQEWGEEKQGNGLDRLAVIWKVNQVKKTEKNENINTVLSLLQKNENILTILSKSDFVRAARKEYSSLIFSMSQIISKKIKQLSWKQIVSFTSYQKSQSERQQQIQSNQPIANNEPSQDQSFRSNHSYKQRHPYETSLYPNRNKSKNKDSSFSNEPSERQNQSRVTTNHHFANKAYMRPVKTQKEEEKPNNIYKIAKGESKVDPKDRQRKVERGKQVEVTAVREEKRQGNMFGETIIGQFIKEAKQVVAVEPKPESEPKPKPEQSREVPIQMSKISEKTEEKEEYNIRKEQQQIPIIPKKNPIVESQIQIQMSQTSRIKPSTRTNPLPLIAKESQINNHITTLSELKLKQSENMHRSTISHSSISSKLRRLISLCQSGQYIEKRHFSSDGGAQRFLMLGKSRDKIFWGESQEAIDMSSSSSSYSIQDIRGIVYGKVTDTMRKECNFKLDSWKCFSLILKKRTFDVYLPQQRDIFFWVPGLSLCLKDLDYSSQKYKQSERHLKRERAPANAVVFGDRQVDRFYSVGRLLWKRFLLRIKTEYLPYKKHEKYNKFCCPNAYAIVLAASRKMGYKQQVMKKYVS